MDIKKAKAILKEAKAHEVITKDISELSDEKLIKLANAVVKKAEEKQAKGENGDHVTSILFLAKVDDGTKSESEDDPDVETFKKLSQLNIEPGIPIPPEIEGSIPDIPTNLRDLSDNEIQTLHGAYGAAAARVEWLLAAEQSAEEAARILADKKEEAYLVTADRKDHGGKPKTNALLKAEARIHDPSIEVWRDKEAKHKIAANTYRRLLNIHDGRRETLSRHWTMRQNQKEGQ